jgi:Xaa-Pro aminopeptidase
MHQRTSLVYARRSRFEAALANAPYDIFLTTNASMVDYITGYRSLSAAVHGRSSLVAIAREKRVILVGPASDAPAASEAGIADENYISYGEFYFNSTESAEVGGPPSEYGRRDQAIKEALARLQVSSGVVGVDANDESDFEVSSLLEPYRKVSVRNSSDWAISIRANKLSEEVTLLKEVVRVTENAITTAIGTVGVGSTEQDLERTVSSEMCLHGVLPRFTVVTTGLRSALGDVYASGNRLAPGQLIRFDIGGVLDGYWSDIGRTAIVGSPDQLQRTRYEAILAGEDAELALARPGVKAGDIFQAGVEAVEGSGLAPYKRHHCGHGIGLDAYEQPIISANNPTELQEGMVFCFETPFYHLGWGGMMVEDEVIVTSEGVMRLTESDRQLWVIDA